MPMAPAPGLSFAWLPNTITSVGYLPLWPLILAALYRVYAAFPGATPFLLYSLLKQPGIAGDMLLGWAVYRAIIRLGGSPAAARRALSFWMLFPYPILISAVWGQFDALVAALVISSLLVRGPWRRSSLLGLGILLKFFPLVLIQYEFLRGKGRARWGVGLAMAIPLLFTLLVFLLTRWDTPGLWRMLGFNAHGVPFGLTYAQLLTSPPLAAYVMTVRPLLDIEGLLWLPATALAGLLALRLFPARTPTATVQSLILIIAVFFLTRWTVGEQHLIYLFPLLLIDASLWHPERRTMTYFLATLGLAYLVVDSRGLLLFAAPAYPWTLGAALSIGQPGALSLIWLGLLYTLGITFSIHLVQLTRLLAKPARDPIPWLLRPLSRRRARQLDAARGGFPEELVR